MEGAPEEKSKLKQIRTFQGDVATALERQRESLVSIQRAEVAKGGAAPSRGGRPIIFFFGAFLLLALGALGAWFAYNEYLRKTAPPEMVAPESRFIPAEESERLDNTLPRESLFAAITPAESGKLKHIILDTTSAEFLEKLESRAPGSLVRALEPEFMLGALGQSRFLIFRLASFENGFAGMLKWEESLAQDLGPLFSTKALLTNIGPESVFKDTVSKNKDARVLYSSTTPVILYSFFDNRMLIITENFGTLETLIERLTRELLLR